MKMTTPLPSVCWAYSPSLTLNGRLTYRSEIYTLIQEWINREFGENGMFICRTVFYFAVWWFDILFIRILCQVIFSRFLPWNSVLDLRSWIFYEIQMTAAHPKCVKFLQIYFHDLHVLVNIVENGCMRKKTDVQYVIYVLH